METNCKEIVETFEEMKLKKNLLRGIFGNGFSKPSKIQQQGILPLINNRDTIAQAQSGSGKTGCFTIGMLQNIDETDLKIQALIIAPTRELARQIFNVVNKLGLYLKVKVHLCIGGVSVLEDKKKIKEGVHIIVGTPGRIRDMMNR